MAQAALGEQQSLAHPSVVQAGQPVKLSKAPDGLFYITAMVNGAPVRFLVDTGANLVVLTSGDAKRAGIGAQTSQAAGVMDTASGATAMERVRLQSVDVAGQQGLNIDAAVMHDGLKVSLLGQSMLSKLGDVTISGDEIILRPHAPGSPSD
jgi:aspartyl protease family protein